MVVRQVSIQILLASEYNITRRAGLDLGSEAATNNGGDMTLPLSMLSSVFLETDKCSCHYQ